MKLSKIPKVLFCWAFALSVTIMNGYASEKKPKLNRATELQAIAKKYILEGRRREALDALMAAEKVATSEKDRRSISARRIIYAEQFLLSDSFEKYQAARGAFLSQNWSDCVTELEALREGDQTNLKVLLLRAECFSMLKKNDAAKKAYEEALAMCPYSVDALLGYSEYLVQENSLAKVGTFLSAVKTAKPREIERLAIVRAKYLEALGKPSEGIEVLRKEYGGSLDQSQILMELGSMYFRQSEKGSIESAWQARKYLALFQKRCEMITETEISLKPQNPDCVRTEELLSKLDKKLNQPLK